MKKNKHNVTLAQLLRDAGWTLEEIGTEVGVSYATVSLWLLTPEQYAVRKEARKEHSRRYYEANKETERERSVKRRKSDPSYKRRYYKANK
jgi:orotate phosphoribosyltransferase-like protein